MTATIQSTCKTSQVTARVNPGTSQRLVTTSQLYYLLFTGLLTLRYESAGTREHGFAVIFTATLL